MASSETDNKQPEGIHLPPPSAVPLATAIGLSILVLGLIVNWAMFAIGGFVLLVSILKWVADVKRDDIRMTD